MLGMFYAYRVERHSNSFYVDFIYSNVVRGIMKNQSGFTLIELMIVIAILGILIAIALPAYDDYTVRTKVAEGLNLATTAKTAVSESRFATGNYPNSNGSSGYDSPTTSLVGSIHIGADGIGNPGEITITYIAPAQINGSVLMLSPTISNLGQVTEWFCNAQGSTKPSGTGTEGTLLAKYAPSNCRQ